MKISRINLNKLIESLLNEDKLPSNKDQLGDIEMQYGTRLGDAAEQEISNAELNLMNQAMAEYIKNSNSKTFQDILDRLALAGMGGLSALMYVASTPAAAPVALPGIVVGIGGLSGAMLGSFVDEVFREDDTTFENKTLRRAANTAGLGEDVGRYSSPTVEEIKATGFKGLRPRDVDPEFKRKLALMHVLSGNIKRDKPYIIEQYEEFVAQGIIDGDAFGAIADEVAKDFINQIKSSASSR